MTNEELQAIEEQYGKLVRFFDITCRELDGMVSWNSDVPVAEFWEMFGTARMGLDDTQRLIAEVRQLRAKLDAVPVEAIRHLVGPSPVIPGRIESAWNELGEWLKTQQAVTA
jgi:hypothetical protein